MKKIAVLFLVAIAVPSIVMAWVALRSLQGQQFVFERQQALLYQGTTDQMAVRMRATMTGWQNEFAQTVDQLLADHNPREIAPKFDDQIRASWAMAAVGFAVSLDGNILAPPSWGDARAAAFRAANSSFLSNREAAEVFAAKSPYNNAVGKDGIGSPAKERAVLDGLKTGDVENKKKAEALREEAGNKENDQANVSVPQSPAETESPARAKSSDQTALQETPADESRLAAAQNQAAAAAPAAVSTATRRWDQGVTGKSATAEGNQKIFSRQLAPQKDLKQQAAQVSISQAAEADFNQIVGQDTSGWLARYLENRLNLMVWYRSPRDPQLVFGAQLQLPRVREGLAPLLMADYGLENDICVALLDDNGKPVAKSRPGFETDWKRPFVATEIGEQLPHWEVGIYLLDPGKFDKSARDLKWSLRTMVALMLLAILTGGGMLVWDVQRQLRLARQKTDFVSNVSHELKTPLTSIRMFSELLAAGKASDPGQSRSYASIIAAEASRLTRLINNVLDFSRMERGEKKYEQGPVAIMELVRETAENYRPHLEAHGFALEVRTEETDVEVKADRDAVAQIILNLISNAEKYGGGSKQIEVEAEVGEDLVRVAVMDRGEGVAAGQEEKIFEQFYRAHDSLSSGIQGSGLGLTLARQMARAQGGDVVYQSRPGGGSIFTVKLPIWRDGGIT